MGRLEPGRPVGPPTARLRREHRAQDLPSRARGARERTGQVVAEGEGQAHLRLVRGDRNPIGPNIPRGFVDQPALPDAWLAVHDYGGPAPPPPAPRQRRAAHPPPLPGPPANRPLPPHTPASFFFFV